MWGEEVINGGGSWCGTHLKNKIKNSQLPLSRSSAPRMKEKVKGGGQCCDGDGDGDDDNRNNSCVELILWDLEWNGRRKKKKRELRQRPHPSK